ncbi:MAG: 4'-phosphopantetheinyl transferase family protein [Gemmataceae bacterium]
MMGQSEKLTVRKGEVDLWLLPLDQPLSEAASSIINAEEQRRADRYLRPVDRRRFVAARSMMRVILGRYLDMRPADMAFVIGPHGKPAIDPTLNPSVFFNLSHSGDRGVLAVGPMELGVDVEEIRPDIHVDGLAARFYAPAEQQYLLKLSVSERRDAFFAIWAGKEAYCKALGLGLHLPTDRYAVVPVQTSPWDIADSTCSRDVAPKVYPLVVAAGFACAVAASESIQSINVREWKTEDQQS